MLTAISAKAVFWRGAQGLMSFSVVLLRVALLHQDTAPPAHNQPTDIETKLEIMTEWYWLSSPLANWPCLFPTCTWKSCHLEIWTILFCGYTLSTTIKGMRMWTTPWRWWGATTSHWTDKLWRKCKYRTLRGQSWWTEEMKWEVSEWRGPDIEDGAAILNS